MMLSVLNKREVRRALALLCYGIIIAGSSVPGKSIPKLFQFTPDKLIHCAEYMVFGFTILFWMSFEFATMSNRKLYAIVLLTGAVAAGLDELYQHLTPGRTPDFYDWCLDVTGVGLSIILFHVIRRKLDQLFASESWANNPSKKTG